MFIPYRDKNNLVWSQKNLESSLLLPTVVWQINLMPNCRLHLQNIKGGECAMHFEWHSPWSDGCFLTVQTQRKDDICPLPSQGTDSSQTVGILCHPLTGLPTLVCLLMPMCFMRGLLSKLLWSCSFPAPQFNTAGIWARAPFLPKKHYTVLGFRDSKLKH